jgi:hypothetical protein
MQSKGIYADVGRHGQADRNARYIHSFYQYRFSQDDPVRGGRGQAGKRAGNPLSYQQRGGPGRDSEGMYGLISVLLPLTEKSLEAELKKL